jgi:hypothetical protein
VPLVAQVPAFTMAAVLYAILPGSLLSWALPLLVCLSALVVAVDMVLPPAWLFLGRSHFDSFVVFDGLRGSWRIFGVTLLNRNSEAWAAYYFEEARRQARHSLAASIFMNSPGIPRIWSLRTRPDMWKPTVWLLMKNTDVIVIDVRGDSKSHYIFDEVLWLAELDLVEKTWYLGRDDGSAPALGGALAWGSEEGVRLEESTIDLIRSRIVTERQLYEAEWTDWGLRMGAGDGEAAPSPLVRPIDSEPPEA